MKKEIIYHIRRFCIWFFVITTFLVVVFRFIPVPFTPLMGFRAVSNIVSGDELEFSHHWRSLDQISPNLQKAVIASEDARFTSHHGFDFDAIWKAFRNNAKGKRIKGGSTISQQTAKNLFLWQGRSYVRKGLEAYFTVLIEIFWPKERIMEVYLNSIEMGDNVYGAQAAAQHWFQVNASDLSREQAAAIAAILPNPRKFKAKNGTAFIQRRKGRIIKAMRVVKLDY
jgi:monofunctional biosynthetic peptidoglycan transglycosylase